MQAWLSSRIVTGSVNWQTNSFSNRDNHSPSCVAAHAAIFSASMEDRATETCCFDCQLMRQHPNRNIKPVMDLLVSIHLARLESTSPVTAHKSLSLIFL